LFNVLVELAELPRTISITGQKLCLCCVCLSVNDGTKSAIRRFFITTLHAQTQLLLNSVASLGLVTGCGNSWWCHPIFSEKKLTTFLVIVLKIWHFLVIVATPTLSPTSKQWQRQHFSAAGAQPGQHI